MSSHLQSLRSALGTGVEGFDDLALPDYAQALDVLDAIRAVERSAPVNREYEATSTGARRRSRGRDDRLDVRFEQTSSGLMVENWPLSELVRTLSAGGEDEVARLVSPSPYQCCEVMIGRSGAFEQIRQDPSTLRLAGDRLMHVQADSIFGTPVEMIAIAYVTRDGEQLVWAKPHPARNFLLPAGFVRVSLGGKAFEKGADAPPSTLPIPVAPDGLVGLEVEDPTSASERVAVSIDLGELPASDAAKAAGVFQRWADNIVSKGYFELDVAEEPVLTRDGDVVSARLNNAPVVPIAVAQLTRQLLPVGKQTRLVISVRSAGVERKGS